MFNFSTFIALHVVTALSNVFHLITFKQLLIKDIRGGKIMEVSELIDSLRDIVTMV